MDAITILEIILLIVSIICFVVSFLIPEKKPEGSGIDQELAREEVKEMVKQEVDNIRGHVDDVVKESMDYAMEKTERSLERLSNEKIMAVNEYSDSVMQEIHKNHEEVVFLYDMLNNKHDSLKKTVVEASKAAKVMQDSVESIQSFRPVAVSYGEGSVRIAPLASKRKEVSADQEQTEQETKESLKTWKPEVKPYAAPDSNRILSEAGNENKGGSNAGDKKETGHDVRPIFGDLVSSEHDGADAVSTAGEGSVGNGTEGDSQDEGRNQNERILALHKEGKNNVTIAKELGLGVGEVKLVLDLYKNS